MAHKRLGGRRKNKLSTTRIKTKSKGKAKNDVHQAGAKKGKKGLKGNPDDPEQKVSAGAKGNKKEARKLASLERMHRDLYAAEERILLVGEGNFSFAHALCKHLKDGSGVYATCFDTEADLAKKYADAPVAWKGIEETGGTCLSGVDACRIHKVKEFKGAFRKVVFNFPHLGSGEKDHDRNIAQHRQLLAGFFASAEKCLDPKRDSSIHVALKTGEPYRSWKVVQTARAACPQLELQTATPFMPAAFAGYAHRRTAGFSERFSASGSEELAAGAKVYVFRKRKRQQQEGSDDD